jgi:microcystin-dependent protein
MSEPFLGQIQPFGFNFAPRGWAFCAGQLLSIAQNSALFSLLGTYYGGDGRVTFALPDLRGRVMINQGQGPGLPAYDIGQMAGSTNETLLITNMPQHNHTLNASSTDATAASPSNNFLATATGADSQGGTVTVQVYGPTATTVMNPMAIGMAGGSQPFSIMQPYLTINICIALEGVFPSHG